MSPNTKRAPERSPTTRHATAEALRRDILALALDTRPEVIFTKDVRLDERRGETARYRDQLIETLRKHGHRDNPDIQLQNDDGRVLATARQLLIPSEAGTRASGVEQNIRAWGLSLMMGGTRGFRIEGGPPRWRIVLGGPGTNGGPKTIADSLKERHDLVPRGVAQAKNAAPPALSALPHKFGNVFFPATQAANRRRSFGSQPLPVSVIMEPGTKPPAPPTGTSPRT